MDVLRLLLVLFGFLTLSGAANIRRNDLLDRHNGFLTWFGIQDDELYTLDEENAIKSNEVPEGNDYTHDHSGHDHSRHEEKGTRDGQSALKDTQSLPSQHEHTAPGSSSKEKPKEVWPISEPGVKPNRPAQDQSIKPGATPYHPTLVKPSRAHPQQSNEPFQPQFPTQSNRPYSRPHQLNQEPRGANNPSQSEQPRLPKPPNVYKMPIQSPPIKGQEEEPKTPKAQGPHINQRPYRNPYARPYQRRPINGQEMEMETPKNPRPYINQRPYAYRNPYARPFQRPNVWQGHPQPNQGQSLPVRQGQTSQLQYRPSRYNSTSRYPTYRQPFKQPFRQPYRRPEQTQDVTGNATEFSRCSVGHMVGFCVPVSGNCPVRTVARAPCQNYQHKCCVKMPDYSKFKSLPKAIAYPGYRCKTVSGGSLGLCRRFDQKCSQDSESVALCGRFENRQHCCVKKSSM